MYGSQPCLHIYVCPILMQDPLLTLALADKNCSIRAGLGNILSSPLRECNVETQISLVHSACGISLSPFADTNKQPPDTLPGISN